MRKLTFVRIVFAAILLTPISTRSVATPAQSRLSPDQRQTILETIRPSLEAAAKFASKTAPARDISELQTQLETLLNDPATKALYKKANAKLDKLATVGVLEGPGKEKVVNFEEVIPGVYRSATPTLAQVESLIATKKIDNVISLNPELKMLAKMDPGTTAPLSDERRRAIVAALAARGKAGERADGLLKLYEDHLTYAQAVQQRSRSYIDSLPLDGPEESLDEYFAALQRISDLRASRKGVLFHCNIGKHRTGLMAMLVESLDRSSAPTDADLAEQYLHFIERNWNNEAQTRIHYMLPLQIIVRSEPFKKLALQWKAAGA